MRSVEFKARPDSTPLFVSLSLSLLVFFAYLSAATIPSKKLLQAIVPPKQQQPDPVHKRKVSFPSTLKPLFVFMGADGPIAHYEDHGSAVLLNGRLLQQASPSGRSYREELLRWLSSTPFQQVSRIELTCFVENTFVGFDLVSGLEQRKRECEALGSEITNGDVKSKLGIFARRLPERVQEILHQRSLPSSESMLLTFAE